MLIPMKNVISVCFYIKKRIHTQADIYSKSLFFNKVFAYISIDIYVLISHITYSGFCYTYIMIFLINVYN